MTDISQANPDDYPSGPDWDNPSDFILMDQRRAQAQALTSLDANPEDAARAAELSKATGVPGTLINGNLEGFEQQHKAALTSSLLRNNQYLAQYANSDPLAAKVSNDDWGQLDTISQALTKLQGSRAGQILNAPQTAGEAFAKKFGEAFQDRPGAWMGKWTPEQAMTHPGWGAVGAVLTLMGLVPETSFRTISGLISGGSEAAQVFYKQITGSEPPEMMQNVLQAVQDPALAASIGLPEMEQEGERVKLATELNKMAPYLKEGKEVPVGVSDLTDKLHAEQAKLDVKNLDEVMSEAQSSTTKDRSPELLANFIRQHTDSRIGIDAEAVRKLYGDKVPEADDNILGWAPGIQDQLALAEAHGGDVEVPLADWVAKVDPEVAKELHDFIRVRPGGMTIEETKEPEGAKPVEEEKPEVDQPQIALAPPNPVDSVRMAAGLRPLPEANTKGILPEEFESGNVHVRGGIEPATLFSASNALNEVDNDRLTGVPRALAEFFGDRLNKMAGDTPIWVVDPETMGKINDDRGHPHRTPAFYNSGWHAIVMSRDIAEGQLGHSLSAHILYHEIAHAATLREMEEFPKLKQAVSDMMSETDQWLSKKFPADRKAHSYAFKNEWEFIAEAFSNSRFQEVLSSTPISNELAGRLKLNAKSTVWDAVKNIVKNLIHRLTGIVPPPSIMDGVLRLGPIFEEAQRRMGNRPRLDTTVGAEPVDRDLFDKANAIGMTKDQYTKYMSLIEKRNVEDAAHQAKAGEAKARERQTAEWKENWDRVRVETSEDIKQRPDIAADRFLRSGELYGQKHRKVRLDSKSLTPEQRSALPRDFYGPDGAHPDDVAGLFGYQSGDSMVAQLGRLEQERQQEGLTPSTHLAKITDAETERQMRKTYGNLEQNILEEAKDHVIGQTQMDLLHEEMVALGTQAHGKMTISKDDVKQWVKENFNKTTLGAIDSDKYLAAARRAGRATEDALLEGSPADAFKAKQQQYLSVLLASEARKLEKERVGFDRIAERFSQREPSGVPAEYANWIHDILSRTGGVVRRSVQDLQQAIGRADQPTLEEFTKSKNDNSSIWEKDENAPSDFQVMPVAPFLFDPKYRKTLDEMTPEEFRAVHNSLKTLIKNGQEDNKVLVGGEKRDRAEVVGEMLGQLADVFARKEKQYAFGQSDKGFGHVVRTAWASLLQIESIFNRFDRGDPKGIFRKVLTGPIFDGSHDLSTLETKYSRMYKELKFDKAEMKRKVDNPIFVDPLTGEAGAMTRGNLLAVLQNVGNPSQLDKLARGFKVDPNAIMQWVFQHTTKEDWDRAQALGDIFKSAFEESARMYHRLSGVAPERIDIQPIQTPFGRYEGWYHPIIYDPLRPGSSKKLMGQNPLEDGAYYRAATPSGYTKKRTGYAAPIQLNFEAVPHKLNAMLRDIAMRPAVTEAAKIMYDPKWQMAITKSYGKEIKDLMIPYLKDIAGQKQYKDAAQATAFRVLEAARQNISATLIGLNPSTVLKHAPTAAMLSIKEVGVGPFLNELRGLLSTNDELGEKNWKFAIRGGVVDGKEWKGSEELQRRQRNWQETLSGAHADVFQDNTLRNTIIKLGATPVAISDLLSAVPTWLASYKQQIRAGERHGDAVAFADTAVRRAHGSSATAARPRIMRGGPIAQFATPFYTFFNEMFQRQYEMAWRAKDALGQMNEGDYKAGLKEVPNLAKGLWAYVVFPALIEQMVSPLITGNQSTTEKVLTYGARTISSSIPVLRDIVEGFLGNRDPTIGMYSTGAKAINDTIKDISKGQVSLGKAHAGRTIKHALTSFGAATGLTNAQEGRTGEYVYDVMTGQQRPKDTGDILRGLWHGQQREQTR